MPAHPMRMSPRRSHLGIVMIFGLMAITIYLAFAFPYTLFHLKQTETTEIKSVIIIGRGGERSPTPEAYFIGEEPPEELQDFGYDQLTNSGKERMYLLGKFLKLRYYHLLLNGDPRKIYARSADTDRSIESAQALLAGLNPPKDQWIWSKGTNELANWQPNAVHTRAANTDDLLSIEPNCPLLDQDKTKWKSSTKYQQLLNEFRHDLETLRADTGLEFEDDLEMLDNIEDALKTRRAFKENHVPAWYTSTFANRLAHISDVTTESRFSSAGAQRLYVGRLLYEIADRVNTKILLHQQILAATDVNSDVNISSDSTLKKKQELQLTRQQQQQQLEKQQQTGGRHVNTRAQNEPNVFVYMTSKRRLAALMNSLQIYSSQPNFGTLLLIELHYDPINQVHFLRLFTVSSSNPNVFPEPLRVNPLACVDSPECAPQQFEQNIRHLMLDEASWDEVCLGPGQSANFTPPFKPLTPLINDGQAPQQVVTPNSESSQTSDNNSSTERPSESSATTSTEGLDKSDQNLNVRPTNVSTPGTTADEQQQQTTNNNSSSSSQHQVGRSDAEAKPEAAEQQTIESGSTGNSNGAEIVSADVLPPLENTSSSGNSNDATSPPPLPLVPTADSSISADSEVTSVISVPLVERLLSPLDNNQNNSDKQSANDNIGANRDEKETSEGQTRRETEPSHRS